jgi:hypothetical protein
LFVFLWFSVCFCLPLSISINLFVFLWFFNVYFCLFSFDFLFFFVYLYLFQLLYLILSSFGRCIFYPTIVLCLFLKVQFFFNYSFELLKFVVLVLQHNFSRLFHTFSFLQLLFIFIKFYFFLKNRICGQNIVRYQKTKTQQLQHKINVFFLSNSHYYLYS